MPKAWQTRLHKRVLTQKKNPKCQKNRSQNEESEVTNHADSMASRRKKDQDKSAEGGTWYYKNRSEIEEN